MHALTILQRCVAPLLIGVHRRRLSVLLEAVAATVSGPRLTLTEIGRRFGGAAELRHRIKRADRLLGNRHLQREATRIYAALARMLLAKVAEPLIVIDWSDLKADAHSTLFGHRFHQHPAGNSTAIRPPVPRPFGRGSRSEATQA